MSYGVYSSPAGVSVTVADLAALAALVDSSLPEGALVFVETVRSYYQKILEVPPAPGDGITIVPTSTGSGDWYRLDVASLSWASQATWYVDPTNGNDENDGSSPAPGGAPGYVGALRTVAELGRRLGRLYRGATYTIQLLADVPATDALNWSPETIGAGPRPIVIVQGVQTVTRTSTLTANAEVTDPTVAPSGSQASITDATRVGLNAWQDGEIVYFPATGYGCYVLRDLGGGVARVSQIFSAGSLTSIARVTNAQRPLSGATYTTITRTKFSASVAIESSATIAFRYVDMAPSVSFVAAPFVLLKECRVSSSSASSVTGSIEDLWSLGTLYDGSVGAISDVNSTANANRFVLGAFLKVTVQITRSGANNTIDGCTWQGVANAGGKLLAQGASNKVTLTGISAFYDWGTSGSGGYAIVVADGAIVIVGANPDPASPTSYLIGFGDATRDGAYGVFAITAGQMLFPDVGNMPYVPSLTGRLLDVYLDGLTGPDNSATAPIPIPTPGNPVVYAAASLAINGANGAGWAQWQTNFARRVRSHLTNAQIVVRA